LRVTAIAGIAFMIAGIYGDELVVALQILDTSLECPREVCDRGWLASSP
jgi:hypothetical protein